MSETIETGGVSLTDARAKAEAEMRHRHGQMVPYYELAADDALEVLSGDVLPARVVWVIEDP